MLDQSTRPRYDENLQPIPYCRACGVRIDLDLPEARTTTCSLACREAVRICACGNPKQATSRRCITCCANKPERQRIPRSNCASRFFSETASSARTVEPSHHRNAYALTTSSRSQKAERPRRTT